MIILKIMILYLAVLNSRKYNLGSIIHIKKVAHLNR